MEIPAEDICISEDMARYDAACKRILSFRLPLSFSELDNVVNLRQ